MERDSEFNLTDERLVLKQHRDRINELKQALCTLGRESHNQITNLMAAIDTVIELLEKRDINAALAVLRRAQVNIEVEPPKENNNGRSGWYGKAASLLLSDRW